MKAAQEQIKGELKAYIIEVQEKQTETGANDRRNKEQSEW